MKLHNHIANWRFLFKCLIVLFKMAKSSLRDLALSHYQNKKTASEIVEILCNRVSIRTVYRWINDFDVHNKTLPSKPPWQNCVELMRRPSD